ncbi:MAG: hypothetical protein A2942_02840 [Candidatus Lloydbacteria bacterium RIFCSPLOWO2_01_FULL_50_20]|uniref:DUF5659 domain-containing protein n=1 Tax=Candidatus Lloydbacteria bacterium RIFCSPLOWO2_01_FULL_50_20 TaxID=1798665 RepID=A0A1G2DLS9_9BACT|nr:MAG: hypothetical protein A2942_02840 [Candidatus Lloydbacteria bacterium RIFCSPLOWO2_01_FULL_50_20]
MEMNTVNENDLFESTDLSLVSALLCFGAVIEHVDRSAPRANFSIHREKGLNELVRAFFAHELKVDPLVYFNCIREAKTRLYQD